MKLAKFTSVLVLAVSSALAQYKMEPVSALPQHLPGALSPLLDKQGTKITGPDGAFCEIWFRATPPPSTTVKEDSVTLAGVAHGAFMGVIHFPSRGYDRRGQSINPGLYTLRLSFFPQNGDHQGVAPQRDFLLLTPIADDPGPAATPNFDTLSALSKKASGTPHPAVLSMWKADIDFKPGFDKMGDTDWVLQLKVAGTPIAIVLVGKVEG
jgi:hypothetical protein